MSKIKNGGLDQYGAEPFKQQQFGTAGVEGVKHGLQFSQRCMTRKQTHKFRLVLTSRFGQDIVENWLRCIRCIRRKTDCRTTLEFESASKSVVINWMLECPCKGANCRPIYTAWIYTYQRPPHAYKPFLPRCSTVFLQPTYRKTLEWIACQHWSLQYWVIQAHTWWF